MFGNPQGRGKEKKRRRKVMKVDQASRIHVLARKKWVSSIQAMIAVKSLPKRR
jgi:hypothetical protein